MSRHWSPLPRYVLVMLAGYVALLIATPFVLPVEQFDWVFSEEGPLEEASLWLWLALGILVLVSLRPTSPGAIAGALLCIAFAAREADLHKAFTGESMLKFDYYIESAQAIPIRVLAGIVAVAAVACLVIVCWCVLIRFARHRAWRQTWGRLAVIAAGMFVFAKACDRTPMMLEEIMSITLPRFASDVMKACEEGLECSTPLLFAVALVAFARVSAALSAATSTGQEPTRLEDELGPAKSLPS